MTDFTGRVREVVAIASSSRGGSSMLAELLRESESLIHLRAEINPFLRLVGLAFGDSGRDSDQLDAAHVAALDPATRRILDEDLALDAGGPRATIDDEEQFVLDAAWRFAVQWPQVDFDLDEWTATARRVLTASRRDQGLAPGAAPDPAQFHLALLRELARNGLTVDPRKYDLPLALRRVAAPRGAHTAPGEILIEEPPFVLPRPWRRADEHDLETKPLVIKTPSNAYRMDFLRALFANARLRIVHLTRNPAAAINGLYEGWRYGGFHAHRMTEPLRIAEYTDVMPADRWWWKFDLPPGWREFRDAALPEVCAFQWLGAHEAILSDVERREPDVLRMRFEDLIRTPADRVRSVARLCGWLGVPFEGAIRRAAHRGIGPVAATHPPRNYRWRRRPDKILGAIGPGVDVMAKRLGYGSRDSWL